MPIKANTVRNIEKKHMNMMLNIASNIRIKSKTIELGIVSIYENGTGNFGRINGNGF